MDFNVLGNCLFFIRNFLLLFLTNRRKRNRKEAREKQRLRILFSTDYPGLLYKDDLSKYRTEKTEVFQ